MSSAVDPLNPSRSPDVRGQGVRRVNRVPLGLATAVVCAFVVMMFVVAAGRAARQNAAASVVAVASPVRSQNAVREIVGNQVAGIAPAAPAPAPIAPPAESPSVTSLQREVVLSLTPAPPPLPDPVVSMRDEEGARRREERLQRLQEAARAKTGVEFAAPAPNAAGSAEPAAGPAAADGSALSRGEMLARIAATREQIDAQASADPSAAFQARLAELEGGGGPTARSGAPGSGFRASPYAQFAGPGDRWSLDSTIEVPRSPYQLRAGFVIPATLLSGVSSDLPGQILGQVSQNVYDSATGKHLLIPQGARLVGAYSSEVIFGQGRLLIAWQRIVWPDGKALDLGAMPGADGPGYAGLRDQVNNHYVRTFASAVLVSGIVGGISLSQSDRGRREGDRRDAQSVLSEALGQQLGEVTAQMIAKNLNTSPTLAVRPGYRFNVVVTKDLTFETPYQAFDYNRRVLDFRKETP